MFSDLNDKQKQAVHAGEGPLLIVAGAGSGKTKTLTARLAYLIAEKKIAPERILAITFTNKAADEMKERVKKIIAKNNLKIEREPFVGTFHSFGARILRAEAARFGRTIAFSIYDGDDALRMVKKTMVDLGIDPKSKAPAKLMREISRIKSELLNREDVEFRKDGDVIMAIFEAYERGLERANSFDFDDLLEKVVRLWQRDSRVREQYQSKYDYILVDEYQDVNMAQYAMVRLLASNHKNINVVGDDQQAIYRFRFSDFRNFLNFERDWPSAKVVYLEQNYRSTKAIIEASGVLIEKNVAQKKKTLWTENEDGSPIIVSQHSDEYSEADFIAEKAREFLDKQMSVGVLYRTNAQSRALEQMFVERGLEYNLFGAVSFYERKEIKDMIAAMRLANNPRDEMSFDRMEKAFGKRVARSVREGLVGYGESAPTAVLDYTIKATDYIGRLEKDFTNYQDRLENIQELINFASQFKTLGEFLEKVALVHPFDNARGRKQRERTGLSLMTIHLAKGLEFDVVFVVGVNEGLLPHQRSLMSNDDIEEERRLMYVAMTRARKELFLNFFGVPSRFLYELPGDKVSFAGNAGLPDEDEQYIEYD